MDSVKSNMYWFAHGGLDPPIMSQQRFPARSTTPGPDTEDDSSESGSLSLKERRAASEEPACICDPSVESSAANRSSEKRQAVEERKRLLQESEQEKNDAMIKKRIEREAAFEARRNAQRSTISFAFGSAKTSETDGIRPHSEVERPRMLPTPLCTVTPKTADNIMTQSMFASMYSARGRRKNDLTPTIPYERTGPPRTAPPSRKRSVSMSRLDQLAQPRKAYVEAQKANSTISNSSKEARHSPTRPLSVASEKLSGTSKHVSNTVTRRPTTAVRKPRPISIAGTVPDRTSRTEKRTASKSNVTVKKIDVPPCITTKSFTSHLRNSRAKSSSTERTKKMPVKATAEKPLIKPSSTTTPKVNKSSPKTTRKSKQSSTKQFTPKTSPARKQLTNKKQAAMLVSNVADSITSAAVGDPIYNKLFEKLDINEFEGNSKIHKKCLLSMYEHFLRKIEGMTIIFRYVCRNTHINSQAFNDFMYFKCQAIQLFQKLLDVSQVIHCDTTVKNENKPQSSSPARSSTPEVDSQSADDKSSGKRIVSEEEAKAALAEKRRLAREQAEKEAEMERLRQEELQRQEEERLRLEEEEQRRIEEEQLQLLEEHREFEKEKLRKAIEEQEKKEEDEKLKREEEARLKAEQEKKAKEEAEKQRIELEEKLRREEEERAERKKRLEKIMSRTRGSKSGTASPGSGSGSDVPDSTESQPEIISSEPNSLDSNMAVESLPIDNLRAEELSASESFDFNQTINLDSQSLSSNDLMIPSSGHTSIDSNIPIATSEHPSIENYQTQEETKVTSKIDDDEEISQTITECTIRNVDSEDPISSIICSNEPQQFHSTDSPVKFSIEDDTLVSNMLDDHTIKATSGDTDLLEATCVLQKSSTTNSAYLEDTNFYAQETPEYNVDDEIEAYDLNQNDESSFIVSAVEIEKDVANNELLATKKSEEKEFDLKRDIMEPENADTEYNEEHIPSLNNDEIKEKNENFSSFEIKKDIEGERGHGDTFKMIQKDSFDLDDDLEDRVLCAGERIVIDENIRNAMEALEKHIEHIENIEYNSTTSMNYPGEESVVSTNISSSEDMVTLMKDQFTDDTLKLVQDCSESLNNELIRDMEQNKDNFSNTTVEADLFHDDVTDTLKFTEDIAKPGKEDIELTNDIEPINVPIELIKDAYSKDEDFDQFNENLVNNTSNNQCELASDPCSNEIVESIKESFAEEIVGSDEISFESEKNVNEKLDVDIKHDKVLNQKSENVESEKHQITDEPLKERLDKDVDAIDELNNELMDTSARVERDQFHDEFAKVDDDVQCAKDVKQDLVVKDTQLENENFSVGCTIPNTDQDVKETVERFQEFTEDSTHSEENMSFKEMDQSLDTTVVNIESQVPDVNYSKFSIDVEPLELTAVEANAVLEKHLDCDIVDDAAIVNPPVTVAEHSCITECDSAQITIAPEFDSQMLAEDVEKSSQEIDDMAFGASNNYNPPLPVNPFQDNTYSQQGIYEQPSEPFIQSTSKFSDFSDNTNQFSTNSPFQDDIPLSSTSNFQGGPLLEDSNLKLISNPIEISEISCDILPDVSDSQLDSSNVNFKAYETKEFSQSAKTDEQIFTTMHPPIDASVLLPPEESYASTVLQEDLPPPTGFIYVPETPQEHLLENPTGFSDPVVVHKSLINPFSTSIQQTNPNVMSDFRLESERFADHGVLKTVDEMNITNLEETNKSLGVSYMYEEVEAVPKDNKPLPSESYLQDQHVVSDTEKAYDVTFATDTHPFGLHFETPFEKYETHEGPCSSTTVYQGFEVSDQTSSRTMNPFSDTEISSTLSEQVLSHYGDSNLNKELLLGVLNSAIEESEDSSLDSNLSQVLHVDDVSSASSEQNQLGALDNAFLTDVVSVTQHDTFKPKTNGYSTTHNNGCLYGDRFESAEFNADQIPVSPRGTEEDHPTPEKGTNANIPTVGNGNILDNADNVNSNKMASNPFLISSNSQQFSGNPFDIKDDKTLST